MNIEFDAEDNIDFFNANFECDDENKIMDLYNIEKSIENNDNIAKKIQIEKFNHPLFLNYNYCLFCLERRKTKYNHNNLDSMHNKVNIKTIGDYLEKNQINLKKPKNKIEKISKRRFIHSYDTIQNTNIEFYHHNESDTELYIEKIEENYDYALSKNNSKKIKSGPKKNSNMNKAYLKKSSRQLSSKLSMEEKEKEKSLTMKNSNSNQIKKKDLYKSDNKNINNFLSKRNLTNFMPKRSNSIKNGEMDDTLLNLERKNLNGKKKGKTFTLFGFISDQFYNDPDNNSSNNIFMEDINDTNDISLQYYEKNEKCRICLDEIKDKFTLFCGDFFCRECIKNLIEESLNNIALFDKIECPRCHEHINDSTIKFFLSGEKLEKYNKIKMRIEGLKDKRNVPCPYPDCEGFALKEEEINGTLECQNGHIFCKKCSKIISQKYRLEKKNTHSCRQKLSATEKYLESNKDIKRCPQCKSWVQRDPAGCNYFQCSNIWCKFVFCWICGQKYDSSHYKNPLSMCFGLSTSDLKGKMIKSIKMRRIRCILIALLLILILLPIIFIFFSFFEIFSFVLYFQFDGKELRNVRFKSKIANKIFYILYILFVIFISIALIPFGYISLVILLLAIPILIIINKCRKKKRHDF